LACSSRLDHNFLDRIDESALMGGAVPVPMGTRGDNQAYIDQRCSRLRGGREGRWCESTVDPPL